MTASDLAGEEQSLWCFTIVSCCLSSLVEHSVVSALVPIRFHHSLVLFHSLSFSRHSLKKNMNSNSFCSVTVMLGNPPSSGVFRRASVPRHISRRMRMQSRSPSCSFLPTVVSSNSPFTTSRVRNHRRIQAAPYTTRGCSAPLLFLMFLPS